MVAIRSASSWPTPAGFEVTKFRSHSMESGFLRVLYHARVRGRTDSGTGNWPFHGKASCRSGFLERLGIQPQKGVAFSRKTPLIRPRSLVFIVAVARTVKYPPSEFPPMMTLLSSTHSAMKSFTCSTHNCSPMTISSKGGLGFPKPHSVPGLQISSGVPGAGSKSGQDKPAPTLSAAYTV